MEGIMNEEQTGSILINLVDGTRQPIADGVKWSAAIHDGRPPDEWKMVNADVNGPAALVKGLPYFDNLFDSYTVVVNAKGFENTGWRPVHISPRKPAQVDLMLLPKDGHLNFGGAT